MLNKGKLRDNSEKSNDDEDNDDVVPVDDDNKIEEASNDSPKYRNSPPRLTQSNDVAWDWHSPGIDRTNTSKQGQTFGTPKSTKLSRNKRNSNSPLLYKPIKRVLIKKDPSNGVKLFKAELQALSNQLDSHNSGQSKSESTENVDPAKDEIIDNIDISEFNNEIDLHENKTNENIGVDDKNKLNNNKKDDENKSCLNKSFDQLLNDSIDDEFMVQCSQEVENKLKFEEKTSNKHDVFTNSSSTNKNTASTFTSDSKKNEKIKDANVVPLLSSNSQNRKNHVTQSSVVSTVLKPTTNINLVTKEKSFPVQKTYGTTKTTVVIPAKSSSNYPQIPKSKPSSSTYPKPTNIKSSNNFSSSTNNTIPKVSSINLPKPSTALPVVETFEILDDDDDLFNDVELSSDVLDTQLNYNSKNNQSTLNKLPSNQAQKASVSTWEPNKKPTTSGGHGSFQPKFFRSKSTSDSNVDKNNSKVTPVSSSSTIKTSNNTKNLGESSKTSKLRSIKSKKRW
ncbi:probable serine/threonine-protein kinase DDB_G0276461 isoform X2 [Aphidius gifuensis]|uniref:probable serine/threonine-protein kinase DDB_G0276461 isoform X2 n=1 Tax=Aphidius gifuensis TaxID=684658 RepID=UPI001CDC2D7E|nr:probable serine/threonine-protein kinase DDB_G0276461 isoform X2 [Aphidius gifuensis]